MGFGIFDEHVMRTQQNNLNDGNTPGSINFMNGSTLGTRVDVLLCANNDVIPHVVWFGALSAADGYRMGSVSIPARAGFDGTQAVDIIAALLPLASPYWLVNAGEPFFFGTDDTLLTGKVLALVATGGDF